MKYFLLKLKEVGLSLLPIVLVVLFIHFGFAHFETSLLLKFIGAVLIIVLGEVLFLTGVDGSVMQMGELVGSSVQKFSKITIVLFFAFIFGLFATVAEPDVSVLTNQILETNLMNVSKFLLIFIIGAGVGVFVSFALFRIIKNVNYKIVMYAIYICILLVAIFVPDNFIAVAFDAGGATTGIITSPFLLALSSGVASNKSKHTNSDNFGVIGIASTGPILAILFLSLITAGMGTTQEVVKALENNIFIETLINALIAIIPLIITYFIFDICFLKTTKKKKVSLILGSLITFSGLYLFLFGIDFGMLKMGEEVGKFISSKSPVFSVLIALVIGFLITFTEPSVKVLGAQVEEVTQGNIRKNLVLIAIAASMMIAVTLSILKIIYNFSIWYIVGIGYGLILVLMPFSSSTFVSIAFDSGGVASGPMSAAFILPLMIGFAGANGGAAEGFGLIASVGMMPILMLEILGVIYNLQLKIHTTKDYKRALRISYGFDMLSNIESLEEAYNRRLSLKKLEDENQFKKEEEALLQKQLVEIQEMREDSDEIKG